MDNTSSYQSDSYDRQSQRFVIPLYSKDELGNYQFSSTGTLAKYKGHHYILFAAHALIGVDFENIYTFGFDGDFYQILSFAIGHQVFEDEDLVVVDCFNQVLEDKNYFNLDETNLKGFEKKGFAWTGFPVSKSKSKKIHRNSSKENLANKFVYIDESGNYFKNARYFTIISKIHKNNNIEITGEYKREKVNLKYQGDVSTGPHPQGMSGGPMYFFSKNQVLKNDLDETFRFAGIGIEYRKDNTIVGVPRIKVIELIEKFDEDNPLQFSLITENENELVLTET